MRERADLATRSPESTGPRAKIHRGWAWRCGCISFFREERKVYLLVPCLRHASAAQA